MSRCIRFSSILVLSLKRIQPISKSGAINHIVVSCFHGYGIPYQQMVHSVLHAFLFSKARINSEFVSTPFRDWKNATGASRGALNRHSASHTHQQCVKQAASFKAVMEKKADSIKSQLSEAYDKQVHANMTALLAIVDSIQFLINSFTGVRNHCA